MPMRILIIILILSKTLSVHSGLSGIRDTAVTKTALGPTTREGTSRGGKTHLSSEPRVVRVVMGERRVGMERVREDFLEEGTSEQRPEG